MADASYHSQARYHSPLTPMLVCPLLLEKIRSMLVCPKHTPKPLAPPSSPLTNAKTHYLVLLWLIGWLAGWLP